MYVMDKKAKILVTVLTLLILWAVWATYDRIYFKKNYMILVEVSCNPETEVCYTSEEDESYFYKIVEKPAYNLPNCSPQDIQCLDSVTCLVDETNCSIIYCDSSLDNTCSTIDSSENNNTSDESSSSTVNE